MKYSCIFCIIFLLGTGCAKKTLPPAPPAVQSEPVKNPDDIKISQNPEAKESKEAIAGMEIHNAKCGRCHGLKNPADWTREEWIPIMDRMAPKARLDSAGKAQVLAYVQAHAKAG